jgi:hypothetical protein
MIKLANTDYTRHSDWVLTKHNLAILQTGWGDDATFTYIDYFSGRPASKKRIAAFERESDAISAAK